MPMLFADDKDMVKCKKCGATTFIKVKVATFKKIKDRQGNALLEEPFCEYLKCSICGESQNEINDLKKHRIIEKPE